MKAGANTSLIDADGYSALMLATNRNQTEAARLLKHYRAVS
ncbi:MAG: hypothetical protein ACLP5H_12170 [Desulfomonilaceae bacterium]